MNRRNFLTGSLGGLTYGAASGLMSLRFMAPAIAAQLGPSDFKCLVCVFLEGGADGLEILVPHHANLRGRYDQWRTPGTPLHRSVASLNVVASAANADDAGNWGYNRFDAAANEVKYFEAIGSDLAFVSGVGPLVEKWSGSAVPANLPKLLQSHSDQQLLWERGLSQFSQDAVNSGWAARMLAGLKASSQTNDWNVRDWSSCTVGGASGTVTGDGFNPFIGLPAAERRLLFAGDAGLNSDAARAAARARLNPALYENLLERDYATRARIGSLAEVEFSSVYGAIETSVGSAGLPGMTAEFSRAMMLLRAGRGLSSATDLPTAETNPRTNRQVIFIRLPGFDTHGRSAEPLVKNVAANLAACKAYLSGIADGDGNLWDKTVMFTMSDFGRQLKWNDAGTDHAWAGTQIVAGGPVLGGANNGPKLYGHLPTNLFEEGSLGVTQNYGLGSKVAAGIGHGTLYPEHAMEEYLATIANWFCKDASGGGGLTAEVRQQILPAFQTGWVGNMGFLA